MRARFLRWSPVALLSVAAAAWAQSPVLHEYIEPNPAEDVAFSATTPDGAMPAALDTESGVVPAPQSGGRQTKNEHAYGGNATPDSIDSSFRVDRDTSRPESVAYDEPFTPAVVPFKRLYAYDAVDESFELSVFDKSLTRLEIAGKPGPADDQFYADLFVDVAPGLPVRIPSVAPGSRPLVARTEPELTFQLQRDHADNWFMVADARRRVRLIMQLAAPRAALGSDLADATWGELLPKLPPLPPVVRAAALDVAREIGVSQRQTPRQVAAALVGYFRSFAPSDAAPKASRGAQLYLELARSRRGVCRHRAYAFTVTALGLGLPTRMVRNEAHAWVEVYDGVRFHRIDLGGAAGRMELEQRSAEHLYRPPADAFAWPDGAESGQSMLAESLEAGGADPAGRTAPLGSATPGASASGAPSAAAGGSEGRAPTPPSALADDRPSSSIDVKLVTPSSPRGGELQLKGHVQAAGEPCAYSRVDVTLRDATGVESWLGAFPSDAHGNLDGRATVPFDIDVGDYQLVARTSGTFRCGPSR
jgi:Transglutaminase-like superfamily